MEAFAEGSGGTLEHSARPHPGRPGAFYNLLNLKGVWDGLKGQPRYYCDNAYFDRLRGTHFRATEGGPQPAELVEPDYRRAVQQGIGVAPWQAGGGHVVVVEQSEQYLEWFGPGRGWLRSVLAALEAETDRELRVRRWSRDKGLRGDSRPLSEDLIGAWALVTHSSAAANEALMAGVPVFLTGHSVASPLASGLLEQIEHPRRPDGREEWAARVCAMHWTLAEIRAGKAWEAVRGMG